MSDPKPSTTASVDGGASTTTATTDTNSDDNQQQKNEMVAMKQMLLDCKVDGGKKTVWSMTLETFGMADGKTHRDDIWVNCAETEGLELLREYADSKSTTAGEGEEPSSNDSNEDKKKSKDKKNKNKKDAANSITYDWELVPLKEFHATKDDLLLAFLKWAEKYVPALSSRSSSFLGGLGGGGNKKKEKEKDEKEGEESNTTSTPTKTIKKVNVSKAARRLDAYFGWMQDNRDDVTDLTFGSIKDAAKIWDIQITYAPNGTFVWWIDLGKLQHNEVQSLPVTDHLRFVVWFAHLVMFDSNARNHGAYIVEDLAHISFWKLATLLPHELSAKMDRLTIGILPVKMKGIYVFGAAGWMHLLMNLMKPFMSKKMRDRMILVPKSQNMQTFCEELVGGKSHIPQNFCQLDGEAPRDAFLEKYL